MERLPLRHSQRCDLALEDHLPLILSKVPENNKLVWDENIRIMMDLFDNVQVRSCCRSLCGYHSPGTVPVAHIIPYLFSNIFTRLPSSLSVSQVVWDVPFQPF